MNISKYVGWGIFVAISLLCLYIMWFHFEWIVAGSVRAQRIEVTAIVLKTTHNSAPPIQELIDESLKYHGLTWGEVDNGPGNKTMDGSLFRNAQ